MEKYIILKQKKEKKNTTSKEEPMEFTVHIKDGEVYINNEFVAQLCWDPDSIGSAIAVWLEEQDESEL